MATQSTDSTPLVLADHGGRNRRYVLDGPTGSWEVENGRATPPYAGFATVIGFRREPLLLASFVHGKTAFLRVGDAVFDRNTPGLLIRDRWTLFPMKRFQLLVDGQEVAGFAYTPIAVDYDSWGAETLCHALAASRTE